jgi:hypothetical protein
LTNPPQQGSHVGSCFHWENYLFVSAKTWGSRVRFDNSHLSLSLSLSLFSLTHAPIQLISPLAPQPTPLHFFLSTTVQHKQVLENKRPSGHHVGQWAPPPPEWLPYWLHTHPLTQLSQVQDLVYFSSPALWILIK